ncbi:hypothetical protein UlMin_023174 [Ulmus minor]
MASSPKHFSFFFLLLLFFAPLEVMSRESKFFSKLTHYTVVLDPKLPVTKTPTPAPAPTPEVILAAPELAPVPFSPVATPVSSPELAPVVPAPAPGLAPVVLTPGPTPEVLVETQNEYGYNRYGNDHGSNQEFPSKQETPTTTDLESEILTEELTGGEGFERSNNYENNGNGYRAYSSRQNGYVKGYNNNRYHQTEQQGMSDTRFLENGRYFHNVKNENENRYWNENENGNRNENNYYNNGYETEERNSRNVFDSMEEYEKYQESRGYVP